MVFDPITWGIGGALLGGLGGLLDGGAQAQAAQEQARLDQLQASSAAAQASLENAADSWRLTINLATGYRKAAEQEAQGAAAGALAAGQARVVASASGLALDHGTTTMDMIATARARAEGEGYAQASALRDQTRRQLADDMMANAIANTARTNNVIGLQRQAQQSRAATAQASNPMTRLMGAASGALGGVTTAVNFGSLLGNLNRPSTAPLPSSFPKVYHR